jgi:hypothetical protein
MVTDAACEPVGRRTWTKDGQNPGSSAFIIASREHDPPHAVGDERYRRERRAIKWMLEKMK